uniref:Putative exonuclease, RNase T and DNA polymerase III n=1 Tax=Magnetococcus massalia (strain MO-1) TaxID=451514 RepID=A0A1S7LD89_MAGMO|nr:Putative exonuclease, RNase T and DNA polymerase III [Candidatus Magnetococcus massalia]
MLFRRYLLELRRKRLLQKATDPVVKEFLSHPIPDGNLDYRQLPLMAIDLETTGLDPRKAEMLSVGFAPIYDGRVQLSQAEHLLISPERGVGDESATIHGILDDHADEHGSPLAEVLPKVLKRLAGHVLVAHHAPIEYNFLSYACRKVYGIKPVIPFIDTLVLEKQILDRRSHTFEPGALRLFTSRNRYNLPRYAAHDALSDAIACGELFLAQADYQAGHDGKLPFKRLLNR